MFFEQLLFVVLLASVCAQDGPEHPEGFGFNVNPLQPIKIHVEPPSSGESISSGASSSSSSSSSSESSSSESDSSSENSVPESPVVPPSPSSIIESLESLCPNFKSCLLQYANNEIYKNHIFPMPYRYRYCAQMCYYDILKNSLANNKAE